LSLYFFVRKPLSRHLLLAVCLLTFFTVCITGQPPTQSVSADGPSDVTFHEPYLSSAAPVKIVRLMLGDKEIPPNTPVAVQGMWLRNVTVVLQNISTKTIVSGGVILTYPKTGDGSPGKPTISTPVIRGRRPDHAYLNKDGSSRTEISGAPFLYRL
jgi:hypothetical protein